MTRDASGGEWCLVGLAVQTDPSRSDPEHEVSQVSTTRVPSLSRSWAGRWLLLGNGRVYPDAAGLLGCFYHLDAEGNCQISSSAQVLFEMARLDRGDADSRLLTFGTGMTWYPPPTSRYRPIRRLLPSQVLHVRAGVPESWEFLPPIQSCRPYEETLALLAQRLVTPLARLPRPAGKLWLSLTSGIDSRLLLAIASHLGLRFQTFTHGQPGLSIGDRFVPPRLARTAGVSHRLIRAGTFSGEAEARYDTHTARQSVDVDRGYYARGQWDFVSTGDILLHGGCFETGRCYYYRRLPHPGDCCEVCEGRVIAAGLGEPPGSTAVDGLDEWARLCRRTPVPELDWRDRLYIEQRLGGWLSNLEQSLDLIGGVRFHPCNAAETYALLLSLPQARRAASEHQRDLIGRLAPHLLELPVNPPEEKFGRLAQAWHRSQGRPQTLLINALRRLASW